MTTAFFTVFRTDPQHYLHAVHLVGEAHVAMPGTEVVHLTDQRSPGVPDVTRVIRVADGPLLQRRLEAYAGMPPGDVLLLDTDISIRQDVRHVFEDPVFDVALTDRHWPHLTQGDAVMHTMPFNTGVAFSRCSSFWRAVLDVWMTYDDAGRADWLSEQRAVYAVVRSGQYRVKILPGMIYNYPPHEAVDAPREAALLHYKGPVRKQWLTARCYQAYRPARVEVSA